MLLLIHINLPNDHKIHNQLHRTAHNKLERLLFPNKVKRLERITQNPRADHRITQALNWFGLVVWDHLWEPQQGLDWEGEEPDYLSVFLDAKGDEDESDDSEDGCVGEEEFDYKSEKDIYGRSRTFSISRTFLT